MADETNRAIAKVIHQTDRLHHQKTSPNNAVTSNLPRVPANINASTKPNTILSNLIARQTATSNASIHRKKRDTLALTQSRQKNAGAGKGMPPSVIASTSPEEGCSEDRCRPQSGLEIVANGKRVASIQDSVELPALRRHARPRSPHQLQRLWRLQAKLLAGADATAGKRWLPESTNLPSLRARPKGISCRGQ